VTAHVKPSKSPKHSHRLSLRNGTAHAHAELDAALAYFDSLDGYRQYLASQYVFRTSAENMLSAGGFSTGVDGWQPVSLVDAIRDDMDDLDVAEPDLRDDGRVQFHSSADISSLFGSLYVLEGSNLGARLLYRKAQTLGLRADFGARHLAVQSGEKDRWSAFLALLENSEIDVAVAVSAANRTFQTALRAFAGHK
jgi:heme oxygenase